MRDVYFKPGVPDNTLNWRMRPALRIARAACHDHGVPCVITSTTDGEHGPESYHPFGVAFDLRTRDMANDSVRKSVADSIRSALRAMDEFFDVVLEEDHIHVEYDTDRAVERAGAVGGPPALSWFDRIWRVPFRSKEGGQG